MVGLDCLSQGFSTLVPLTSLNPNILGVQTVLCIMGGFTAPLVSARQMPVILCLVMMTRNALRYCQLSPGGQNPLPSGTTENSSISVSCLSDICPYAWFPIGAFLLSWTMQSRSFACLGKQHSLCDVSIF